jgi:hypothetical protein
MASEPDPRWMVDAARAVGRELGAYVATAWAVIASPRRFALAWSDGTRRALNPLAFLLNALAVLGPWRALWARLLDPNPPTTPLWWELGKPAVRVVSSAVGMALCHALVRLFGGRRPLRTSLAMSLYISGGPLVPMTLVSAPLSLYALVHRHGTAWLMAVLVNFCLYCLLIGYTVIMLRAVHQLSRWRVVTAVLIGWALFGTLWGWVSRVHPELVRSMMSG